MLIVLLPIVTAQTIKIDNIDQPILAVSKGIGRIQIGTKYYIHHFNISRWKQSMQEIEEDFEELPYNQFTAIIGERMDEIHQSINYLQNRRSKRWDTVGTVWKFIAGNPDANDLRMINNSINDLVKNNNIQVTFNFDLNLKIQEALHKTTQALNISNKHSKELSAVNVYLHINHFARYLESIVETVALGKSGIFNKNILSQEELAILLHDLDQEHIKTNSIAEALSFASVTITSNAHELALLIKMPKVDPRNFTKTLVFPIVQSNHTILHLPEIMFLVNAAECYIVKTLDLTIYKKDAVKIDTSTCAPNLLKGLTADCDYISNPIAEEIVNIDNNHILMNTVSNFELITNCGIADRNLTGSFLFTYENCQLLVNKSIISNGVQHLPVKPIPLQLDGIVIKQNKGLLNVSLDYLHQAHLETRKELDMIHLQNNSIQWPHLTIFGGIAVMPMIIVIIVALVIWHRRRIAITMHTATVIPMQATAQVLTDERRRELEAYLGTPTPLREL
ncbi:uncharacterized protein LOC126579902 [Anopheles aquasalis]|uniref:uncharacterized protein LOC126579902 n=1 Tax=Anopheles aquasalis TaxID=42839 RepID=UPI00215B6385|nr:uncharacterized protein LOC126579902 [Anopheles aquasalis]